MLRVPNGGGPHVDVPYDALSHGRPLLNRQRPCCAGKGSGARPDLRGYPKPGYVIRTRLGKGPHIAAAAGYIQSPAVSRAAPPAATGAAVASHARLATAGAGHAVGRVAFGGTAAGSLASYCCAGAGWPGR